MFGIVQGGLYKDLREESINNLVDNKFDGYALGGLAVGETQSAMFKILKETTHFLPPKKTKISYGCRHTI